MAVDSLIELKSVFDRWRSDRANIRIPIPRALIERAARAAATHGPTAVRQATRIPGRHLVGVGFAGRRTSRCVVRSKANGTVVPAFSRVELKTPSAPERALAEVETPAGMKLRIFTATAESLGLINMFCVKGGAL